MDNSGLWLICNRENRAGFRAAVHCHESFTSPAKADALSLRNKGQRMDRRSFLKIGALTGMGSMLDRSAVATALAHMTQPILPMFGPGTATAFNTQSALDIVFRGLDNIKAMEEHAREWSELVQWEIPELQTLAGKKQMLTALRATEGAAEFA